MNTSKNFEGSQNLKTIDQNNNFDSLKVKNLEILKNPKIIKETKKVLRSFGLKVGRLDGNFNTSFQKSIITFQKDFLSSAKANGIIDEETQKLLFRGKTISEKFPEETKMNISLKLEKKEKTIETKVTKKESNISRLKLKEEIKQPLNKDTKKVIKDTRDYVKLVIVNNEKKEIPRYSNIKETGYFKNFNERIHGNELLQTIAKTKKGVKLLEHTTRYSPINIEKLASFISEAAAISDVPADKIISLLVGESAPNVKRSPFTVNFKGIGQFTQNTWGSLYKKFFYVTNKKGEKIKRGGILEYFKVTDKKGLEKYINELSSLNISRMRQRVDPRTSIIGIGLYVKYLHVARKLDGDYSRAVAMYNVGHNKLTNDYITRNPVVLDIYNEMYPNDKLDKKSKTFTKTQYQNMLNASERYYNQY